MIVESLLYLQNSSLNASTIILEPEITHSPTLFDADLIDPSLIIECFYRLFRIVKISKGRMAFSEKLAPRRYDPIITVEDDQIQFEAFSNDMTNYACLVLDEEAFTNVHQWELGQTNVDFTPDFINNIRKAGSSNIRSIAVDPDGFYVDTHQESFYEKKVELPENWEIGLDNLRNIKDNSTNFQVISQPSTFIKDTPFGPFCNQKFGKLTQGWKTEDGWGFARLNLRNDLGHVVFGSTSSLINRFDGRQNPKYEAVRSNRMLRSLKSYFLQSTKLSSNRWEVKGSKSGETRYVEKGYGEFRCSCEDFKYRSRGRFGFQCKHIRCVLKPDLDVHAINDSEWHVYELSSDGKLGRKFTVEFDNQKITCSCSDYNKYNICNHIIEVLKVEKDFQFEELKQDLC